MGEQNQLTLCRRAVGEPRGAEDTSEDLCLESGQFLFRYIKKAAPADINHRLFVPPMSSETQLLFHAVTTADTSDVQRALAAGADVNASDKRGRNIVAYAALGDAYVFAHFLDFLLNAPTGSTLASTRRFSPGSHRPGSTSCISCCNTQTCLSTH